MHQSFRRLVCSESPGECEAVLFVLFPLGAPRRGRARGPVLPSLFVCSGFGMSGAPGDERTKAVKGTQNILINEESTSCLCLVNQKAFCKDTKKLLFGSTRSLDIFRLTQR